MFGQPARIEVYIAFTERCKQKDAFNATLNGSGIRVEVSISIYLFSRIVRTTTVSILHGVFFLSSLPLLLPPHCFFSSFFLFASISLFCCAPPLCLSSPLSPLCQPRFSSSPFSPSSPHPLAPFVPLPLYDSSQLLPFLFYSFPSLLLSLASLTRFFVFSFLSYVPFSLSFFL